MRTLVVTLSLLASGFLLATPYLTSQELQDAFQSSDTEKIDELVDFDSVRKSVAKQLSPEQKQDDGLLTTIGKKLAVGAIELVVDAVVTPQGLAQIMEGNTKEANKKNGSEIPEDALDYNMYYVGWNRIHIDVVSTDDTNVVATFVLSRSGTNWIVTEILITNLQ